MEATERPGDWSPELIRRLVENAIERVHEIQEGERIEREPMKRYVWVAGAVAAAAIALFTFGPAYLRHTLSAIFVISTRRRSGRAVSHRGEAGRRQRSPRAPIR